MKVLISGASSGIGMSIAKAMLEDGHEVIGFARRREKLNSLVEEGKGKFHAFQCDVCDVDSLKKMKDSIAAEIGTVDVLVNNAGVGYLGEMRGAKLEEWHAMFDINVKGLLSLTHLFLEDLIENKGFIFNIDSVAGHEVYPTAVVYCSSKWAVKAISMGLEKELRGKVKICNISPGAVETEFVEHTSDDEKRKQMKEQFQDVLNGEDIAAAVRFAIGQRERSAINEITIRPWK